MYAYFLKGLGAMLSGALNAYGKQSIVAIFNLVAYYAIGMPFGFYLTFNHGWGLVGIWSGVVIAGFIKCICEGWALIYLIDTESECRKAARRVSAQEEAGKVNTKVLPTTTANAE